MLHSASKCNANVFKLNGARSVANGTIESIRHQPIISDRRTKTIFRLSIAFSREAEQCSCAWYGQRWTIRWQGAKNSEYWSYIDQRIKHHRRIMAWSWRWIPNPKHRSSKCNFYYNSCNVLLWSLTSYAEECGIYHMFMTVACMMIYSCTNRTQIV